MYMYAIVSKTNMLVLFHLTQNGLQKSILINNVDLQDNAEKS